MSMIIDHLKLWNDEGYGKDNPLENTITLIMKTAKAFGLPKEAAQFVINETFLEMARGKKWPLDHCPCGCGIDKSGTAVTHYMLDKLRDLTTKMAEFKKTTFQDALNDAIILHVTKENAEYINSVMRPSIWSKIWTFLNKKVW